MNEPDPQADHTGSDSPVYGPVRSWRFGQSLGIDPIVSTSACSFNCVYCQLGDIRVKTAERQTFVSLDRLRADLADIDWNGIDVVTLSGSGEPTLAANLGPIIDLLKELTTTPVLVLTNATLLGDAAVRRDLMRADMIACKLDATDDAMLERMNRPVAGINLESILTGIRTLRGEFTGRLLLQIMLMPMNLTRLSEWVPLIRSIQPDEVHLNTPRRPYPMEWYRASRGDHTGEDHRVEKVALKVITPGEAREAEALLKRETGVPMVSVYRT